MKTLINIVVTILIVVLCVSCGKDDSLNRGTLVDIDKNIKQGFTITTSDGKTVKFQWNSPLTGSSTEKSTRRFSSIKEDRVVDVPKNIVTLIEKFARDSYYALKNNTGIPFMSEENKTLIDNAFSSYTMDDFMFVFQELYKKVESDIVDAQYYKWKKTGFQSDYDKYDTMSDAWIEKYLQ